MSHVAAQSLAAPRPVADRWIAAGAVVGLGVLGSLLPRTLAVLTAIPNSTAALPTHMPLLERLAAVSVVVLIVAAVAGRSSSHAGARWTGRLCSRSLLFGALFWFVPNPYGTTRALTLLLLLTMGAIYTYTVLRAASQTWIGRPRAAAAPAWAAPLALAGATAAVGLALVLAKINTITWACLVQ